MELGGWLAYFAGVSLIQFLVTGLISRIVRSCVEKGNSRASYTLLISFAIFIVWSLIGSGFGLMFISGVLCLMAWFSIDSISDKRAAQLLNAQPESGKNKAVNTGDRQDHQDPSADRSEL